MNTYRIRTEWEGTQLGPEEETQVTFSVEGETLRIQVDAPYWGNEAPPRPSGEECICLWEFEVVEVFIKGRLDKYLEVEMSPHDQYLILALDGHRQVFHESLNPLSYKSCITKPTSPTKARSKGQRWLGEMVVPLTLLPPPLVAGEMPMFNFNAYALHNTPEGRRRVCALFPVSPDVMEYEEPDCHRLHLFQPMPNELFKKAYGSEPEQFAARSQVWSERLQVASRSSSLCWS